MENIREQFQIMARRFGFLDKNCCSIEGIDISLIQSHILYEIDRQHQPSIQEVAEALGIDLTTFSRQIQSLTKKKLVQKSTAPTDRRVSILSLTPEGKQMAAAIDKRMNTYLDEVFSHMSAFEMETVIRSIRLLNDAMSKSRTCCTPAWD